MILVSMILVILVSISNVNGYLIGPNVGSWAAAEAYCVSQGSHLATICNDAERDRAKALCSANDGGSGRGCWIGLYEETMNVWKWADGSPLGYGFDANSLPTTGMNPWHSGEPNNHGGQPEDCIHLFDSLGPFNWNDAICNDNNLPLCNDPEAEIEYEMCNYDANTETVPNSGVGSYSDLDLSKGIADGFASIGTSIEGYDEVCFDIQSTNSQAECIRIPINVDYNAIPNLSYELYLKQGAIENNFGWIMSQDDGAYDRSILMHDHRYDPVGETYGLAAGTGSPYVGSAPLPANIYKHLVVVFEGGAGGTAKIYVDGVLVSTDVVALNSVSRYDYICLNTNPGHNGHGWNGCMSEVRIYKRALTQEQVTSLAQGAPSGKCDYAPPDDECERGVNYEITGRTCIAWGDPHFTTWNGDTHDFQGQMNSGKRRFYYVTPCADYCSDDMPFSIIGNHYSWGGRQVSGVDYLTLELYESNADTYSVYISGSILAYALNANGADYDQAFANGILTSIGGPLPLGTRFTLSYSNPNAQSVRVVVTIDGQCTVKINMYGQYYYFGRWRMHRMEILPLDCYQCMACGLCGGYKRQRGAYQLETCNGGSVPFQRGWGANNAFAWDLEGNTWEKGYRDNECPICLTPPDPDTVYQPNITDFEVVDPCDPDIADDVINACQDARDAADNAGDCCNADICDALQDGCEIDACVAANGDITAIDDAVQEVFTDQVTGICTNPSVEPTLDPTNTEGEGSGCTQNSECGNNGICNNPGPNGRCSCEDGYRGDPDSGLDCEDINECGEGDPCPEVCTNEDGGVSCACNNPIFDVNGDGSECVEPPYVVAGPLDCQAAQEYCKNTFGTQLATIRTAEDRTNAINALTDAGEEYGWIGLYSDDVETKWQFRSGATCPSASAYKCVDFWLESFKDGGAYRPRCIGPTENGYGCAVFYRDENGVNNDKDVTDPIPFLCDE